MAHSSFGLVFDVYVLFTITLWTKPCFVWRPRQLRQTPRRRLPREDGARKLRMLCRSIYRGEHLGTNGEDHMIIHSGSCPDTPLSFLALGRGEDVGRIVETL